MKKRIELNIPAHEYLLTRAYIIIIFVGNNYENNSLVYVRAKANPVTSFQFWDE